MDEADRAAVFEQAERDRAFQARRRQAAGRALNASGLCADCGDDIDPRRLAADPMVSRCVSCQADVERRAARWR